MRASALLKSVQNPFGDIKLVYDFDVCDFQLRERKLDRALPKEENGLLAHFSF